jgi:hypothetical protein
MKTVPDEPKSFVSPTSTRIIVILSTSSLQRPSLNLRSQQLIGRGNLEKMVDRLQLSVVDRHRADMIHSQNYFSEGTSDVTSATFVSFQGHRRSHLCLDGLSNYRVPHPQVNLALQVQVWKAGYLALIS